MNIAIVLLIFSHALLAIDYDYDDYDYDYCNDEWYLACDGDFCTVKTKSIYIETEVPIPDTNLSQLDYNHFDVLTYSALKECTPSLGIKVLYQHFIWTLSNFKKRNIHHIYRTLPIVQKVAAT